MTALVEIIGAEPQVEIIGGESVIEIISGGPQGPPGPGGAAEAFVHTQLVAASPWTINHNLGQRPTVSVFDAGGQEIEAHVVHASLNQTLVYFAAPQAGSARLI
jgi:hypothetical protein